MSNVPGEVRLVDDGEAGERDFMPGARGSRRQWVYDLKAWWMGVGPHLDRVVELAGISTGQVVLDVGCGTGNLSLRAARAGAAVTGLDPDRSALERAVRKARRRRLGMTFVRGYADRLPVDDASVDHVISSLALHHVPADQRAAAAAEILRVLRPGGTVTVLDFAHSEGGGHQHGGQHGHGARSGAQHGHGGPHEHGARPHPSHDHSHAPGGRFARRGQELARAVDAADGGIENVLRTAGLVDVVVLEHRVVQGTRVEYLQARRPTLAG